MSFLHVIVPCSNKIQTTSTLKQILRHFTSEFQLIRTINVHFFLNKSKEELRRVFQEREVWYSQLATRVVDVTKSSPEKIIEELR